jgi:hypothetical protein
MTQQKAEAMEHGELIKRIDAKIMGLEIAVECELAVVAYLMPFRDLFQKRTENNDRLTRRNRQLLDSEHNIKLWTQEIDDLRALRTQDQGDQTNGS